MEVKIQLHQDEAEWLVVCLGHVMQLARHWDSSVSFDPGNAILAKVNLARVMAETGVDPDEWLSQRRGGH